MAVFIDLIVFALIYLLMKGNENHISESDNYIESTFECQINN